MILLSFDRTSRWNGRWWWLLSASRGRWGDIWCSSASQYDRGAWAMASCECPWECADHNRIWLVYAQIHRRNYDHSDIFPSSAALVAQTSFSRCCGPALWALGRLLSPHRRVDSRRGQNQHQHLLELSTSLSKSGPWTLKHSFANIEDQFGLIVRIVEVDIMKQTSREFECKLECI